MNTKSIPQELRIHNYRVRYEWNLGYLKLSVSFKRKYSDKLSTVLMRFNVDVV